MACSSRLGGGLRGQGSRAGPAHLTVGAAAWQVSLGQTSNRPCYPGQRTLVVLLHDYAHLVPFVETADGLLLKTIIPSRKATRRYISET